MLSFTKSPHGIAPRAIATQIGINRGGGTGGGSPRRESRSERSAIVSEGGIGKTKGAFTARNKVNAIAHAAQHWLCSIGFIGQL
jgi:hypothetical protein